MELRNELRESIKKEMFEVLEHYKWKPANAGIDAIIDAWWDAKSPIIDMFSTHPNWREDKLMLVFSSEYTKPIDTKEIDNFYNFAYRFFDCNKELVCGLSPEWEALPLKPNELYNAAMHYRRMYDIIESNSAFDITINGFTKADKDELWKEYKKYMEMQDEACCVDKYNTDRMKAMWSVCDMIHMVYRASVDDADFSNIVNGKLANIFNETAEKCGMKANFVEGQKIMKALRRFFVEFKLDKSELYNQMIARLGDAITPLNYTRHTIISCNPIDYLRSSMGTSWSSCHTIDRANVDRRDGDSYSGMHAKGNLSYMCDPSTVVMYTVHNEYCGNDFELQDKVTRQLYHIGENYFVQGRLYPQSNDEGSKSLYNQYRAIFQKVIADCMSIPNLWAQPERARDNSHLFESQGSHYRDYTSFSNCVLSRTSESKTDVLKRIHIGSKEICITCGEKHIRYDDELSGCHRFSGNECYECGCTSDYMHEIGGEWYCEDCCFYCEYHEEWEASDYIYVENYGKVCDDGINFGDFYRCERCDAWCYMDGGEIVTEDGYYYCCEGCAEYEDYVKTEDTNVWIQASDAYCCYECGCWYQNRDSVVEVDDEFYCPSCAPEQSETEEQATA